MNSTDSPAKPRPQPIVFVLPQTSRVIAFKKSIDPAIIQPNKRFTFIALAGQEPAAAALESLSYTEKTGFKPLTPPGKTEEEQLSIGRAHVRHLEVTAILVQRAYATIESKYSVENINALPIAPELLSRFQEIARQEARFISAELEIGWRKFQGELEDAQNLSELDAVMTKIRTNCRFGHLIQVAGRVP